MHGWGLWSSRVSKVFCELGPSTWPWRSLLILDNLTVLLLRVLVTRRDDPRLVGRVDDFTASLTAPLFQKGKYQVLRTSVVKLGIVLASERLGILWSCEELLGRRLLSGRTGRRGSWLVSVISMGVSGVRFGVMIDVCGCRSG